MNADKDDDLLSLEDNSIEFIRNFIPQELKEKFSDDDIETIEDLIYDFYEEKGYLDQEDGEVDIDETEMIAYVLRCVREEGLSKFEDDDITFIVQGEIAYCESLGMFE